MNSGAKKPTRDEQIEMASRELFRISESVPVFIENAHFSAAPDERRGVIVLTPGTATPDRRHILLRWLVPNRPRNRRIRLDAFGTFVASNITGKRSSEDIIQAFQRRFGTEAAESREACLLFLRSLAKRGVIAMVEKNPDPRKTHNRLDG